MIGFKYLKLQVFLIACLFSSSAFAELTLEQVLESAIKNHPTLQARHFAELSKEQEEREAQSPYYPKISGMALASAGFPGSAGATGVAGLMVSPFHRGPAAGVVLEQNIWDFGRTLDSVRLAEKETDLSKKDTLVSGVKIANTAQEAYFLCSRDRSLAEVYRRIASESGLVEKEVDNFVRVGQRSIVDKYLSKSQTEEAKTLEEDFKKRYELDHQRLAYLIGQKGTGSLCPVMEEGVIKSLKPTLSKSVSPLLSLAEAHTAVALAQKNFFQKDFNPRVVGFASAGWLGGTELGVPLQNYSAAVAVIIPLFEGFKTVSQVKRFELKTLQNEKIEDATRFHIDEANLEYDRGIESAQLRISHLKEELEIAETAFHTAKKRYLDLQGNLVDLREVIRNLARTSGELKGAFYDLAVESTSKALLNGSWNPVIGAYQERSGNK